MNKSRVYKGNFSRSDSVELGKILAKSGFSLSEIQLSGTSESHCGILAYNAKYRTFEEYEERAEQDYLRATTGISYTFDWSEVSVIMSCQNTIRLRISSDEYFGRFFWKLDHAPHQHESAEKAISLIDEWITTR